MNSLTQRFRIRHIGAAMVISSVVLLGCARKVMIQVPSDFHGHVRISCGALTEDGSTNLRVDSSGTMVDVTCPIRQAEAVVTRSGTGAPVETSVLWLTTGDGLVREMSFDIP
jgi:hypothetical protein